MRASKRTQPKNRTSAEKPGGGKPAGARHAAHASPQKAPTTKTAKRSTTKSPVKRRAKGATKKARVKAAGEGRTRGTPARTIGKASIRKTSPKRTAKQTRAPRRKRVRSSPHPKLQWLLRKLRPGRYAGGTLVITEPGAHHDEMRQWLMGKVDGRTALGRTAFGDIVVFRDLRARAAAQGLRNAETACDVAVIDLNLKTMIVLAESAEALIEQLDQRKFQNVFLRRKLYDRVKMLHGELGDDETYAFVPALALGGSEDETQVQRQNWSVYQQLLFQL